MTLLDQNTSVVDGLGETELVDASLETALQEVLNTEGKNVIELHARLVEHTDTDQTANQGITFEQTLGVLLVEGKKLTMRQPLALMIHLRLQSPALLLESLAWDSYRAARRILDRVSWTRHTSRLLRRPYSPTIFSSESLLIDS